MLKGLMWEKEDKKCKESNDNKLTIINNWTEKNKNKNKNELSKQLEQEQIHRNGDHL